MASQSATHLLEVAVVVAVPQADEVVPPAAHFDHQPAEVELEADAAVGGPLKGGVGGEGRGGEKEEEGGGRWKREREGG